MFIETQTAIYKHKILIKVIYYNGRLEETQLIVAVLDV